MMETYLNEQETYLMGLYTQVSELKDAVEKGSLSLPKEEDKMAVFVYPSRLHVRTPKDIMQGLYTDLQATLFDIQNTLDALKIARRVLLGQE